MTRVAVHYHELALKGANRPVFLRALARNLEQALAPLGDARVRPRANRLLVESAAPEADVVRRATRVCGVAFAMPVRRMPRDLDAAGAEIVRLAGEGAFPGVSTFRVSAKRADKTFPMTSVDINRRLGAIVHEAVGWPVRLRGADLEIYLTVLSGDMLVGFEKHPGPGGLPVGTGGRVAVLMSGGIDSPVAAWRMMNRGCRADLIHFHSHPLVDKTTQDKARDLAEALTEWQYRTRLHLAPLARVQTEVRLHCPEALRVVLYRRFMVRIAERIARRRRCGALVTGESLGQVASQTLANLSTVDAVAEMPVLRLLIGLDKQEIIAVAQRLGTFDSSSRPDQDCCQRFVPPRPATKARREDAEAAEEALDVDGLVEDAVARTENVEFGS